MIPAVLVVTPSTEFGDLVCQALRDSVSSVVQSYPDKKGSIAFLESCPDCSFAIVDISLGDKVIPDLVHTLRQIKWDVNIILVAGEEDLSRFDELHPWKQLQKPFRLDDLLTLLGSNWPTVINIQSVPVKEEFGVPWLLSSRNASLILNELTQKSDVREAILIRNHRVWASTGHLKDTVVENINQMVNHQMNFEKNYDLFRYVKIEAIRQEYGLYAKFIVFNAILAVMFDLVTPANRMRENANLLAEQLSLPLLSDNDRIQHPQPRNNPNLDYLTERSAESYIADHEHSSKYLDYSLTESVNLQYAPATVINEGTTRRTPLDWLIDEPKRVVKHERLNQFLRKSNAISYDHDLLSENMVAFSGLMTPRFERQNLQENIVGFLYKIFPQLCVAYGWRLWSFEINRNCIQWTAEVPLNLSALDHVQIIKHITSEWLSEENSYYMDGNLSGDFWAPGFLVTGGKHHYSEAELFSFLRKIRLASTVLQ
jgi:REP element-mobilizing transposase RayT